MTLNCLACSQALQRTNSDNEFAMNPDHKEQHSRKLCCRKTGRSRSGNLASPPYEHIRINPSSQSMQLRPSDKKVKKSCRRLMTTASAAAVGYEGNPEPKLVRSVGMRRDWSFEDLRQRNLENGKSWRLA